MRPTALPKRVRDFVRGRWVAKQLLADRFPELAGFAVLPSDGGVPEAYDDGLRPLPVSVSISHSDEYAAAALVDSPGRVGIDVEGWIQAPDMIAGDYFTQCEQAWCAGEQRRVTGVWSLKEALLKAVGEGLRWPLTAVEVRRWEDAVGWCEARVNCGLRGWVRFEAGGAVAVAVSGQGCRQPGWRMVTP
ncbi:MAG: 4'-phosphopantetheinyl transferase superfamily protein [Polyangiaceae bacterium]|nr:4'-phosphopantetheinyl transferase superfamily protein [Polyangiaceae bacterium]